VTASVLIATEAVGVSCFAQLLRTPRTTFDAPLTYSLNAVTLRVSRREFDGAVGMNRQVERMVRSLDVRGAHAHARARGPRSTAQCRAASALSSRKERAFGWRTPSYPLRTRTVGMSRF